ncbi:hypothetical protein DY000_02038059 [Brassica cretica]|uniref:Uncharacterized protein n=1 Tax=Brassica cretica TaxID=69181 RepID=A0ABQ7BB85_BRACR|nr:hypothetical protein DY000_02038059 [Brassica cretica]
MAEEDVSSARSESFDTSNQRLVYLIAAELFDLMTDITTESQLAPPPMMMIQALVSPSSASHPTNG